MASVPLAVEDATAFPPKATSLLGIVVMEYVSVLKDGVGSLSAPATVHDFFVAPGASSATENVCVASVGGSLTSDKYTRIIPVVEAVRPALSVTLRYKS